MGTNDVGDDETFLTPAERRDDALVAAHLWEPHALSFGYKEAGDALARAALDRDINPNLATGPLLFTYRHAIELALKTVVGERYLAEHENLAPQFTHSLARLWAPIEAWLASRGQTDSWTDFIRNNIELLDQIDPNSTRFRYADDRATPTAAARPLLENMSIARVAIVLGEVWERIDAIWTMRYEESQDEAENYFANYDPGDYDPGDYDRGD